MFREEHHERKLPHTGILFRRLVGGGVTHFCRDAEGKQMIKVKLVVLSSLEQAILSHLLIEKK